MHTGWQHKEWKCFTHWFGACDLRKVSQVILIAWKRLPPGLSRLYFYVREYNCTCVIIYLFNCLRISSYCFYICVCVSWYVILSEFVWPMFQTFRSPSCARAESTSQFLVTTLAENGIFSSGPKVPNICPVSSVANTSTAPGPRPRPLWRKSWMLPLRTTYITRSSETPWRRRVPCWCRSWWKQFPELCPPTFFTSWWETQLRSLCKWIPSGNQTWLAGKSTITWRF